jgi:hypothetical protein
VTGAPIKSPKRLSVFAVVACLAVLGGVMFGGVAAAKKKKSKAAVLTRTLNAPIPDRAASSPGINPPWGKLAVPLEVSKKFKGKTVGSLQLSYQTTGATPIAASDISVRLTAPAGRTYNVESNGFSGQSIGPVTFIPNSPVETCHGSSMPPPPPCSDPNSNLNPPYQGVAGEPNLTLFEGLKMRGTWTVTFFDTGHIDTSTLNTVSLTITPQKPAK